MKETYYTKLLSKLPIGYGLHEIKVDEQGTPIDYVFLDVNQTFERFTGLKRDDIIGKSILEVLPDIQQADFDWIAFYGNIAIHGGTEELTQYSSSLERTYKVTVYSPEKHRFITLFYDYTIEQEREKVLHNIIEKAPIPIMIHAEDGEVVHLSDEWTKISGYTHSDIPNIPTWTKKAYGTKQQEVASFIDNLYHINQSQHDGEFRITTKDGSSLLWDFYSTYLGKLYDGRKIAMSVALDITKKTALQDALIREKQLQEITLMSVGDGVITTDKKGNITLLNNVAEELTGWNNADAIGKDVETVFQIYGEHTNLRSTNIVQKVIQSGTIQNLANSTMLHSKDGTIRPIADSASPIINKAGEIVGVVIVFRDYTEKYKEQKRVESLLQELSQTKSILQSSLDSPNNVIIISLDKDYRYLYYNESHRIEMERAYGSTIEEGKCIFDYMTSKKDIENIKNVYDKALSGQTIETIDIYGDHTKYYYQIKINPIYNEQGNIFGISIFSENVTPRIEMEQQILHNEQRYKGLVENLAEGVVIHAPDTSIININTKASELLGVSIDELHGVTADSDAFMFLNEDESDMPQELYPVTIIKHTLQPLKDYILGIKHQEPSTIVWVSVNGIPLFDDTNNLQEIVISFKDITEERTIKKRLEYSAFNDFLTGLHNRRYYEISLSKIDIPDNYPISIIMADINGLKLINDAFGHAAGDELLVEASKVLNSNTNSNEILARIGGDEFVMVLPKTSSQEANSRVQMIKQAIQNITINSIPLSISFGHSTKTDDNRSIHDIFRNAEDIMYREKLLEIPSMRSSAIEAILKTLYEKDPKSEVHSRSVSIISEGIAKALNLTMQDVSEVKTAALLHDIGKIIISSSILLKKGKLTIDEYAIMKTHSEIGFRILNSTQNMRSISNIVLNHHERWDGKGYPRGIKGEDIPLKSRIITVADAYDAMTSERQYRKTLTKKEALNELNRCKGSQFDEHIVDVFIKHFDQITSNI
jgi:diguanylate cyclase (GGDEF)-like protein/PAS domain S-box-containing protein/putative nucleotidyltransferase with HDIG domain